MRKPQSNTPQGKDQISQQVITNMLAYVQHGRLMTIMFALGCVLALAYFTYGRPIYFSRTLIRVNYLGLPVHSDSGKDDGAAGSSALAYRGLMQKLESGTMQLRVAQKLGFAGPGEAPENVRMFITPLVRVDFVDGDTLQVSVESFFPEVVRRYGEVLIAEYEAMEHEQREEVRTKALDAYLVEIDAYRAKIDEKLKQRMGYEQEHDLAQLFIQQNSLTQVPKDLVITRDRLRRMKEVRDQLELQGDKLDTISKLSVISSFKAEKQVDVGLLTRNTTQGTLDAPSVRDPSKAVDVVVNPNMVTPLYPWQELEKRQRELQAELKRQSVQYLPGHEVIKNLTKEIAAVDDKLKAELTTAIQSFDLEKIQLEEKLKGLEAKLPDYHKVTAEFEKFRLDYDLKEKSQLEWDKMYTQLQSSVAKLQYGANKDRLQLRLMGIETLRDEDPISPSKIKLLMMGLGLGLGLAFSAPLLLRFFNSTASRLSQVENATGISGIGVVPMSSAGVLEEIFRSPMIDAKVPNHMLESFRVIRSQILLRPNKEGRNQVVMVTSARPSEGKSTLSANLAWAFYSMGERTLLVDCDLRRGRVAKITGVPKSPGLTSLLVDMATQQEVTMKTQSENLDVIPRGPIIVGSTEILCQVKFHDLVAKWRTEYDRIVLDTPPVLGLSETVNLQQVADGVVLVVRAETTRVQDVTQAAENLRRSGAHMFGFVLNAVDLSKVANYYDYYYYSADYYYEFAQGEDDEEVEEVKTRA